MQRKLAREIEALVGSVVELERALAEQHQLRPPDLQALELLRQGPMHPKDLAPALGYTSAGICNLLDRLEDLGYVIRRQDPEDRRRVIIFPTELAEAQVASVWAVLGQAWDAELVKLSDKELERLLRLLRQFHRVVLSLSVGR